jgi:carbamoyltransferase
MSTRVLGISAFYHDAAAALVEDGRIVAAAQEERFSRKKHDPRFPLHAINYCLEEAALDVEELDAIAFYDNPVLTWDRVVKNCIVAGESSRAQFRAAAESVLGSKVWVERLVRRALGGLGKAGKLLITEHHFSHAASAYYPSPFERAAILTLDGVGEWATTTLGAGEGDHIDLLFEIDYPHSVGLLYSAFTYFCGFKVNSGEYKLMGLAPYGKPVYAGLIRDHLISIKPDGSYRLNTEYFGYLDSLHMTNEKFASLFGGPRRPPESTISRREMDLAASIQCVLEEVVLRMAQTARQETGAHHLVMAGGVALNCVANGKLLRAGIFEDIWVQPAAGDAGGSVGAALLASHEYLGVPRFRHPQGRDAQRGSYLGPAYRSAEVRSFLDREGAPYHVVSDAKERTATIAKALSEGKIVGFFQGRMEFGPRSLGARSILGDPRDRRMQSLMNLKIKYRESFRPFAPAVLHERVAEYFELDRESPYMLLVAPVREDRRLPVPPASDGGGDNMLPIINTPRSDLPAITHVDYSARVQTIHPEDSPGFYGLVKAFEEATGCGVIVNTSFNVRGEPIVCRPKDAYICFMRTEIDLLVLEDCLLWKSEQPKFTDREDWKTAYELCEMSVSSRRSRVISRRIPCAQDWCGRSNEYRWSSAGWVTRGSPADQGVRPTAARRLSGQAHSRYAQPRDVRADRRISPRRRLAPVLHAG